MKYRKKPIVVDAFQFNPNAEMWMNWKDKYAPVEPTTYMEVHKALGTSGCSAEMPFYSWDRLGTINTLEGKMICIPGDWIIKGVKGEFYPCKDEIFKATYEIAE